MRLLLASLVAALAGGVPVVARVADGDTLTTSRGDRVRLVQIDTPELGGGECYSRAAARELTRLAPPGTPVRLEADPALDDHDRYGRLLRYVWANGRNVNLELVRRGAATVWFYDGDRGRHANALLAAAREARTARRGLWGACPSAVWNPSAAATTDGPVVRTAVGGACDGAYPGVCIAPPPPDLDCADVPYRNFRVLAPDPHRFDGDGDGRGCE